MNEEQKKNLEKLDSFGDDVDILRDALKEYAKMFEADTDASYHAMTALEYMGNAVTALWEAALQMDMARKAIAKE